MTVGKIMPPVFSSRRGAEIIALRIALVGVVAFFCYHSVLWHSTNESSSFAVYAMKIIPIVTLIPLLFRGGIYIPRDRGFLIFNALFALTFFTSIITAIFQDYFSLFYFIADLVGFLIFWLYVQFGYMLRVKYSYEPKDISKELSIFLFFISVVIILGFILSGGQKVSIPPDMHFATVFLFLCFFLKENRLSFLATIFLILLVSSAAFLSLHKITLGGVAFSFIFLVILFLRKFSIKSLVLLVGIAMLFCAIVVSYGSNLFANFSVEINNSGDGFQGSSANQRISEALLIYDDLTKSSRLSQVLGKGFGAHYFNSGIIEHYPQYVHQGHSTPFILWIRNGVFGVVLFFYVATLSFRYLFSKTTNSFILSASLFYCFLASVVDLYIYWGFFMGLGTGMLFGQINIDNKSRKHID